MQEWKIARRVSDNTLNEITTPEPAVAESTTEVAEVTEESLAGRTRALLRDLRDLCG
jgi:hypothetical protein